MIYCPDLEDAAPNLVRVLAANITPHRFDAMTRPILQPSAAGMWPAFCRRDELPGYFPLSRRTHLELLLRRREEGRPPC